MVQKFFREIAASPERAPYAVPQTAVAPLYPLRVLFANQQCAVPERRQEAFPLVARYPVVAYAQLPKPLFQPSGRFLVAFSPCIGDYFPGFPAVRVHKPFPVLLRLDKRPKPVDFKAVVVFRFRFQRVFARNQRFQHLSHAYAEYGGDVARAVSPCRHGSYQAGNARRRADICPLVIPYELTAAGLAQVVLCAVAFLPVSGYVVGVAAGVSEFHGDCHSSMIALLPLLFLSLHTFCITTPFF